MNKKELVAQISTKGNIPQTAARRVLDKVLTNMARAMEKGEKVTISGFGSFHIIKRAAQAGRNPQTGEQITIPARRVVKFRPAKKLTNLVG